MNKFDKIPLHSKDSLRRYFVDAFFLKKIESINKTCFVLDLGGNKSAKRGLFNIEKYLSNVIYLNFSTKHYPDIQADALYMPFIDNVFDCIVCSEMLEHIRKPMDVLREIHRILRPRASLLQYRLCFQFMLIHMIMEDIPINIGWSL